MQLPTVSVGYRSLLPCPCHAQAGFTPRVLLPHTGRKNTWGAWLFFIVQNYLKRRHMSIIYYTTEEQAAHRRLWADRLAKHDLEQAFGALRIDCGYCVLGVGCEVFYASTGLGHWEIEDGDFWFVVPDDDPMVTTRSGVGLPDQVMEFYGFEFEDGGV